MNRGWYVVLSMMCIFVIAAISFVACHNESDPAPADDGIEYLIPENAEVTVDQVGIIRNDDGNLILGIGVRPSAYYLPKDIKEYRQYFRLLNTTDGGATILRLTIGNKTDKGIPIVKVGLPNDEEIKLWHELHEEDNLTEDAQPLSRSYTSLSSVISSVSEMNTIFNYIKNLGCPLSSGTCIPFRYAADGCYARAHCMRKILADNYNYDCQKIFSFGLQPWGSGTLKASSLATGCCATWDYHVAVVVVVDNGVACVQRVFDPSLFSQPVTVTTWLNAQTGCNGNSGTVDSYEFKSSSTYGYNLLHNTYDTDNSYSSTLATLSLYANSSGCN
ncbi:MAG: hypothetical protein LBG59_07370 [Candidatus Peribacteria bacterium]|nr:hypothetical protein [Candidatus Peribacteria bacterium]